MLLKYCKKEYHAATTLEVSVLEIKTSYVIKTSEPSLRYYQYMV